MTRWKWVFRQLTRRLWVRATLIGALGIVAAIFAAFGQRYSPWRLPGQIGADAVDSILNIIASSMLAVTTFSLSVMTSAYGAATNNVTPRATKLLMEDRVTQNVLSTFIGSFLFAIVGIIVLKTGAYGDQGRVILFVVTIGVIALIVVSLLHWIDHLTRLGRVGETTDRVEQATREAMETRLANPYLGGSVFADAEDAVPDGAHPVEAGAIGYVQHVDISSLSHRAEDLGGEIYLVAGPGTFVFPDSPIAFIDASLEDEEETDDEAEKGEKKRRALRGTRDAFAIGSERSFDQDPRFGLAVMSEIASRALSSAVNDTGTAIDVIGRMARLLTFWHEKSVDGERGEPRHPHVHVAPLKSDDLFEDAFMLIARDGAGLIEVQLRIQKTLAALGRLPGEGYRAAAMRQARLAYRRAEEAMRLEEDWKRLQEFVRNGEDKAEEADSPGRAD